MTKTEALYGFFNSFGMSAYPVTAVPDNATLPYLTYEIPAGYTGDQVSIGVGLWFHTESEAVPNATTEEIGNDIGLGGIIVSYDGGAMWIKRGTPWATAPSVQDNTLKYRALNVTIDYL